ncbi:MAG: hypothetical protein K6G65_05855 [Lachnospiraceae bacterium]|nr:hypothetical protein [Lachnospiraceae bacterium]
MDYGSSITRCLEEFQNCEIQLVVGSLSPWSRERTENFLRFQKSGETKGRRVYLMTFGEPCLVGRMRRRFGVDIYAMPYQDLRQPLAEETAHIFESIITKDRRNIV